MPSALAYYKCLILIFVAEFFYEVANKLMNHKNPAAHPLLYPRIFSLMENMSKYADLLLIAGTGILFSLNILTVIYYFKELNSQVFQITPPSGDEFITSFIELIIGKNLIVLDFFYVGIYQFSGILACRFKISYISFLVYIQLCKIILSPYVPKNLIAANIGLQVILALQMFMIILNFDLKKHLNLQDDQLEDLTINI